MLNSLVTYFWKNKGLNTVTASWGVAAADWIASPTADMALGQLQQGTPASVYGAAALTVVRALIGAYRYSNAQDEKK